MKTLSKIEDWLSKAESKADDIAMGFALLAPPLKASGDLWQIPNYFYDSIFKWRFPDATTWAAIKAELLGTSTTELGYGQTFKGGIIMAIAGYLAKAFGINKVHPLAKSLTSAAETMGLPLAVWSLISTLVHMPSRYHASNPTVEQMVFGTPKSVKDAVNAQINAMSAEILAVC